MNHFLHIGSEGTVSRRAVEGHRLCRGHVRVLQGPSQRQVARPPRLQYRVAETELQGRACVSVFWLDERT